MPITLARRSERADVVNLRDRRVRGGTIKDRGRRLRLELLNNMPDSAVFATQRQFLRLLDEGAREFDVTLGLATLNGVTRSLELKRDMAELYRSAAAWSVETPDAVIVTGAEPRAPRLDEEPYWRELTAAFDSARKHSVSTLASCLAAHALVLHLDRVERRRFARKWSGLFRAEIAAKHALTDGLTPGLTPHSRWNGLEEADLAAAGYLTLTRVGAAGVDMFAKDDGHLTLLLQGHPEYDADTLAREYRRDALRAARGEAQPPEPPTAYYPPEVEARLRAHVARMIEGREVAQMPAEALQAPEAHWRRQGATLIGNWLAEVAARKRAVSGPTFLRARYGG